MERRFRRSGSAFLARNFHIRMQAGSRSRSSAKKARQGAHATQPPVSGSHEGLPIQSGRARKARLIWRLAAFLRMGFPSSPFFSFGGFALASGSHECFRRHAAGHWLYPNA
jgi:hypothetical protein